MGDMQEISFLPKTRRCVTGHSPDGKAIFDRDDSLAPLNPFPSTSSSTSESIKGGFTLIHRTEDYPVKIQGGATEFKAENLHRGQGKKGIICQVVDIPPAAEDKPVYMHRNQSLDYSVILKGSIQLILDDGAERTLREGHVFVQR